MSKSNQPLPPRPYSSGPSPVMPVYGGRGGAGGAKYETYLTPMPSAHGGGVYKSSQQPVYEEIDEDQGRQGGGGKGSGPSLYSEAYAEIGPGHYDSGYMEVHA